MTENDDKILELLAEGRPVLNKKAMLVNFEVKGVDISYSTIRRRLPLLEEANLIELVREQGKYYMISEEGLAYLSEEHQPPEIDD